MKKERKSGVRNAKVKNEISKMWNCRGPAVAGPLCGSDFLNFAFCTLIFELNEKYG